VFIGARPPLSSVGRADAATVAGPSRSPRQLTIPPVPTPDPLARLLAAARERIDRYEPAEVPPALAAGGVLIDLRTDQQRRCGGVVRGSIWYPRNCLEWRCAPDTEHLDPAVGRADGLVILICLEGYATSLAAATLRDLGVARAGDVVGGFRAWQRAGLPVEPWDAAHDSLQGSAEASIRDY